MMQLGFWILRLIEELNQEQRERERGKLKDSQSWTNKEENWKQPTPH